MYIILTFHELCPSDKQPAVAAVLELPSQPFDTLGGLQDDPVDGSDICRFQYVPSRLCP